MTYLMSDIHGNYDKYMKMLDLIRFTDRDELYVLGDVVDRGAESMKILRDMSLRINVFPILGNHDWTARVPAGGGRAGVLRGIVQPAPSARPTGSAYIIMKESAFPKPTVQNCR